MIMDSSAEPVVLSLSYGFHDSCVALSVGTEVVCVLELERLFRIKKMSANRDQVQAAALLMLNKFGLGPEAVDLVVTNAAPHKFWNTDVEPDDVEETSLDLFGRRYPCLEVRHHLAHAGMYYLTTLQKALVLPCDGGGNQEFSTVFVGEGDRLTRVPHGRHELVNTIAYGVFSGLLYGKSHSEGKMMGLAALGAADEDLAARVRRDYAAANAGYAEAQRIVEDGYGAWRGTAIGDRDAAATLARAVQRAFVELRCEEVARLYRPEHGAIMLLGGSALNLECNSRVFAELTREVHIPPDCDDTGLALGQLAIAVMRLTGHRLAPPGPYLGLPEGEPSFRETFERLPHAMIGEPAEVAARLARNAVCCAHVGRGEVGPRALGHRSYLMAATRPDNRTIVSEHIKRRESYRPVAPIVREDDAGEYFENGPTVSPYMLFNHDVRAEWRDRLTAITHFDGTARVQTVSRTQEPFVHEVLTELKALTGVGVLINTSLNASDEPLTDTLAQTVANFRAVAHTPKFVAYDPDQAPKRA